MRWAAWVIIGTMVGSWQMAYAQVPQESLNESLASEVWLSDWENAFETLAQGADPNTKLKDGTPVLAESIRGNKAFAKALVKRGADPNTMGEWGWPVICTAACVDLDLTKTLLDRGANLQLRTKDGYSALTAAAMANRPEIVAYLLNKGFPVEGRSTVGSDGSDQLVGVTPLMVAAKHAAAGSMKALLDAGADPKAISDKGVTPLAFALSGYALIPFADKDKETKTAQINAAMTLLLERGASVDQRTACLFFYPGSSWNPHTGHGTLSRSECGFTPLILATAFHWYGGVQFLLQHGADPSARSDGGMTALHWAAMSNGDVSIAWLLNAGADPNVVGELPGYVMEKKVTPLMVAASCGSARSVELLLKSKADPNRVSAEGIPTIAFAWRNYFEQQKPEVQQQVARALLDGGADPAGRPSIQAPGTPVIPAPVAVMQPAGGGCEAALWLIEHGADQGFAGSDGRSLASLIQKMTSVPGLPIEKLPDCYQRLHQLSK